MPSFVRYDESLFKSSYIIFFSSSVTHFHFFSGHINTFSKAYSKSFDSIIVLFSFAILSDASLVIFSISAHTNQLVLFDNDSNLPDGDVNRE